MPCGTIIKSFSTLAHTLSGAGAEVQLTGLASPTQIDERAEKSVIYERWQKVCMRVKRGEKEREESTAELSSALCTEGPQRAHY